MIADHITLPNKSKLPTGFKHIDVITPNAVMEVISEAYFILSSLQGVPGAWPDMTVVQLTCSRMEKLHDKLLDYNNKWPG